jgi:hypothetical protein
MLVGVVMGGGEGTSTSPGGALSMKEDRAAVRDIAAVYEARSLCVYSYSSSSCWRGDCSRERKYSSAEA